MQTEALPRTCPEEASLPQAKRGQQTWCTSNSGSLPEVVSKIRHGQGVGIFDSSGQGFYASHVQGLGAHSSTSVPLCSFNYKSQKPRRSVIYWAGEESLFSEDKLLGHLGRVVKCGRSPSPKQTGDTRNQWALRGEVVSLHYEPGRLRNQRENPSYSPKANLKSQDVWRDPSGQNTKQNQKQDVQRM